MNLIKNIFPEKNNPIQSYSDFWTWFGQNQKDFFNTVKKRENIEMDFLGKVSSKISELKDGIFCLTGMHDENTVELVLTADGDVKHFAFIEELVEAAPRWKGWKFTSLKPALDIEDLSIQMGGHHFTSENLFFYPVDSDDHPDEINIRIIHDDLTEENTIQIIQGVYIFLDNYLGELDFARSIDDMEVIGHDEAEKELIPITKLKSYLTWRQKEFVEKYDAIRYNTENDEYSVLEAELQSGNMLLATVNSVLLNWDNKASHPWLAVMTIKYDGTRTNGMPKDEDFDTMNIIEDEIMVSLIDKEGYLNIGRDTAENERRIFFACKDFRKPSKIFHEIQKKYSEAFEIEYNIFKDKYWRSLEKFR